MLLLQAALMLKAEVECCYRGQRFDAMTCWDGTIGY